MIGTDDQDSARSPLATGSVAAPPLPAMILAELRALRTEHANSTATLTHDIKKLRDATLRIQQLMARSIRRETAIFAADVWDLLVGGRLHSPDPRSDEKAFLISYADIREALMQLFETAAGEERVGRKDE